MKMDANIVLLIVEKMRLPIRLIQVIEHNVT